jgi:glycosyltransferase involved in cell wall biosynthesis
VTVLGAYTKSPVLLVGNFLSAAGGSRGVCEELATRLPAVGWAVLTTSSKQGRLHRVLDMAAMVLTHRHHYHIAQVDVYSGPAFVWAEVVCLLLRRLGKQYILAMRGGNLPRFAHRWPGRVRRLLASAAVVTVPSTYLLEQMRDYRRDLHLLPNPLDLSVYTFQTRSKPEPSLVWLRAFHEVYNPSMAPKVVALLAQDFPETHLTMVGPDKGDGSLQRLWAAASQLGVERRISTPGGVSKGEVPTWLERGDIFLNTTNVDNTPVSVMEAMACGLCVVSTNVDGIPYLLEHEQNALLVPPNNPEEMAAAVRRILTEPSLAEHISRNARQKAEQFDWSSVLPRWDALFTYIGMKKSGKVASR